MRNRIYLDHAATTAISPEVLEAMMPCLTESYGNASGVYATGREAHRILDRARKQAAEAIGATAPEICFTSGGSESDSWALIGTATANRGREITSLPRPSSTTRSCAPANGWRSRDSR